MTMSQQRYNELDANGGPLTPAEQAEGWHFCPEFDGLLTMGEGPGPCPCGIHGDSPLQLTRDPEPHGTREPIDLIRPQDPDLVDAVYEPTYAEHVDLIAKAKEYLATVKAIVHQHDGQWYFWEETYSQRIGPYSTEIAANKALDHYCDVVLGQGREPA